MFFSRFRSLTGLCLILLGLSGSFAGPIPANKPAHYPDWWFERDVIPRLPAHAANPAPTWPNHYPASDDYAVANIGQLKALAVAAAAELNILLPAGAGSNITTLVGPWQAAPAVGVARDDFAVVNQGQLKAVASHFYDRLRQVGYFGPPLSGADRYPWTIGTNDDNAFSAVNLGQLKFIFSFIRTVSNTTSLSLDAYLADEDLDGMPNGWEVEHGLDPFDAADANLLNGAMTNLQAYQQTLGIGGDPAIINPLGLMVYSP